MNENEIKDAYEKNEKLGDLLPELNDEELDWAWEPRQTAWAYNKLTLGIGYVWVDDENGFSEPGRGSESDILCLCIADCVGIRVGMRR